LNLQPSNGLIDLMEGNVPEGKEKGETGDHQSQDQVVRFHNLKGIEH
jgi:hypothetical protein